MSTGISWTDETWTVVTGCSKVSTGCKNCYAETLATRLSAMGKEGYTALPWTKGNAEENVTLRPERLEEPLRWRRPRRVFVTSMGDLFHELVPFEFVDRVFAVMALARRHTFQVLTKRPERMAEYMTADFPRREIAIIRATKEFVGIGAPWRGKGLTDHLLKRDRFLALPNVWLGTSVEDQRAADGRIPNLLRTPAAVRFLSCEPLIGPVDMEPWIGRVDWCNRCGEPNAPQGPDKCPECGAEWTLVSTWGEDQYDRYESGQRYQDEGVPEDQDGPQIHWVIAGGESGPNHRPMKEDWARSLRDQCVAVGVPFFFKQHSGHRNETGPELDGREWRQMPGQTPARPTNTEGVTA